MVRLSQGSFSPEFPEEPGDSQAGFHRFFRATYAPAVRWAVAAKGLSQADAEDVLQEAYASIFQHWKGKYGLRPQEDLVRLLRYTVTRKMVDAARREQRRQKLLAEVVRMDNVPYQRDGRGYDQLVAKASEILAELPPVALSVFQRHFVENQSIDEICDSLGLSAGAVRAEIRRVRRALQEGLAPASASLTWTTSSTEETGR